MTDAAHAKLGPSSAHRWMACPGSVRASAGIPDDGSEFAKAGTAAHALAALVLGREIDVDAVPLGARCPETGLEWDTEMREGVTEYVEYVRSLAHELNGVIFVERRVRFDEYVEGGFGTADVLIIAPDVNVLVDLKFGRGVRVLAQDAHGPNPQLMLYAVGARQEYGMFGLADRWRLVIHQPRLDSVSFTDVTDADLTAFAARARHAAAETKRPDAPLVPGDHCKFCLARGTCRARAELALAEARAEFGPPAVRPDHLTLAQIADILPRLDEIESWCADLRATALQIARSGQDVPGYKVVLSRSQRRWFDEAAAAQALVDAGAPEDAIWERSLIGLGAAEKLLGGKKAAKKLIDELTTKPRGAPTLVPLSDPRPAELVITAAQDFG